MPGLALATPFLKPTFWLDSRSFVTNYGHRYPETLWSVISVSTTPGHILRIAILSFICLHYLLSLYSHSSRERVPHNLYIVMFTTDYTFKMIS